MAAPNLNDSARLRAHLCDDALRIAPNQRPPGVDEHPAEGTQTYARHCPCAHHCAQRRESAAGDQQLPPAATAELVAIPPRRKLRTERLADAHERRSVAKLRQTDVVGRNSLACIAVQSFRLLDRLPPLLER